MKSEDIKAILDHHKHRIFDIFYVDNIGLFGSYIRDEHNEDSDIDILVSFKSGHKDFFNYMRLKKYLEDLFDKEVDLVSRDSIKSALKNIILDQIDYV